MPRVHLSTRKHQCHFCPEQARPRAGFFIESVGCDIQARVVVRGKDGSIEREINPGHRRVWREAIFVCDRHVRKALTEMRENLVAGLGDVAFMEDPDIVNCSGPEDLSPLALPGRGYSEKEAEPAPAAT